MFTHWWKLQFDSRAWEHPREIRSLICLKMLVRGSLLPNNGTVLLHCMPITWSVQMSLPVSALGKGFFMLMVWVIYKSRCSQDWSAEISSSMWCKDKNFHIQERLFDCRDSCMVTCWICIYIWIYIYVHNHSLSVGTKKKPQMYPVPSSKPRPQTRIGLECKLRHSDPEWTDYYNPGRRV